jgi:hypothetical protein
VAVTTDGGGTAAVETGMALPVQGVQKTDPRLEKGFLDRRLAAPEKKKVKKPAGLKRDLLDGGRTAWALAQQYRLGTCSAVRAQYFIMDID